jgi:hypothetical protein
MDLFDNNRNERPVVEATRNFSDSISPNREVFNKALDTTSERLSKIDSIISDRKIDSEFTPSEFVNLALKTELLKPSDLRKSYDSSLRDKHPELSGYAPETYVTQLMFGKLDNTNLKPTEILASLERNVGVNKTYAVLDGIGLIPERDVNAQVIDVLDRELSATNIAHFFQDVLGY